MDTFGDGQRMVLSLIAACAYPTWLLRLCRLGKMKDQVDADFPSWKVWKKSFLKVTLICDYIIHIP